VSYYWRLTEARAGDVRFRDASGSGGSDFRQSSDPRFRLSRANRIEKLSDLGFQPIADESTCEDAEPVSDAPR